MEWALSVGSLSLALAGKISLFAIKGGDLTRGGGGLFRRGGP